MSQNIKSNLMQEENLLKIIEIIRNLREEGIAAAGVPTNNASSGNIAGLPPDQPPVDLRKKNIKDYHFYTKTFLGERKMFNQGTSTDTKVAVLEEKVSIYEKVMSRIEDAIFAISETSQGISKMLAIHEERLEQAVRSDEVIIKMIDDLQKNSRSRRCRFE